MARLFGLASLATAAALAGCGGGGGGGTGTAAPAPPPPAPTPTPLSLTGPSAPDSSFSGGGGSRVILPLEASGVQVVITDPDILNPRQIGEINFDGDETVVIRSSGQADVTLPFVRQDATFGATAPYSLWQVTQGTDSQSLLIYRPSIGPGTPAPSRFVTIARSGVAQFRSAGGAYQLLGVPTAAADMPANLAARYEGLAIAGDMTARAVINVGIVGGQGAVTGVLDNRVGGLVNPADWRLQFSAPVSGVTFSGVATLSYTGISPQTGQVYGAFYGPAGSPAAEVGGVWAVPGATIGSPPVGANGAFVAAR